MSGGLPMKVDTRPTPVVTLPADTVNVPTLVDSLPMNIGGLVLTTGDVPTAIASLPADNVSLPTGIGYLVLIIEGLPMTAVSLPVDPKTSKISHFSLFFSSNPQRTPKSSPAVI